VVKYFNLFKNNKKLSPEADQGASSDVGSPRSSAKEAKPVAGDESKVTVEVRNKTDLKEISSTLTEEKKIIPEPPDSYFYIESTGKHDEQVHVPLLENKITIGRALDNILVIDQTYDQWQTVSRHHVEIYLEDNHPVLEDKGSLNGTFINGVRTRKCLLKDSLNVQIGRVEFICKYKSSQTSDQGGKQ
jgi:pSer/pThr/pTyr-binding forkhead associated (FHA) protein